VHAPCCSCRLAGKTGFGPKQGKRHCSAGAAHFGALTASASAPGQRGRTSTAGWDEQTLEWQSPWEHRANDRQKCRTGATDFTTDQSLEVE